MAHDVPNFVCAIISGSDQAIRRFLTTHSVNVEASKREKDDLSITVFIAAELAKTWNDDQLRIEVLYNATERGLERQKEVGKGNRFAKGDIPKGLGELVRRRPS